jgi:transcriptional regulator with XRE-family HTH domain
VDVYDFDDIGPNDVGRRLREIRQWRGLTLQEAAGLAGVSYGYLGKLERGEKALSNRATLEALARALRVAPSEFSAAPWSASSSAAEAAHGGVVAVETALDAYEIGDDPGGPVREWPDVAADVARLRELSQGTADYAAQAVLMPRLLGELHAVYARHPERRADALVGMIGCYASAAWTTKRMSSGRGLPLLAARLAQDCAALLGVPAWQGFTAWLRGDAAGALSRPEQYRRTVRAADALAGHMDDGEVVQAAGMLHLSAALASAVQGDADTADTHLSEADALADRLAEPVGTFGRMWFGRANVGVWRMSIGLELGGGAKLAEAARTVPIAAIPAPSRQAEFYMDVGRALLTEHRHRDRGIAALLRAEQLAPQRVHADVFVREAVADHLRAARRDAGGRNLRGLAWRLGIAPDLARGRD